MLKMVTGLLVSAALSLIPGTAWASRTQIIVQWVDDENHFSAWQIFKLQGVFDDHADEYGYDSDGNDIGSGTENFYLYADDRNVDAVVRNVVSMRDKNLVPGGMRIGVAIYKDVQRRDWTYRPVYPKSLKEFDITYSRHKKPN